MDVKTRYMLAYLDAYLRDNGGAAPQIFEIKEACLIRPEQTVERHLKILESHGCIERSDSSIKVVNSYPNIQK